MLPKLALCMTAALSMGNNKIADVASPVNDGDVVNKGYVDENMGFKKKLIFDGTVNAPANTYTIMNTSVSYDEGIDLKGIIIKINDSGYARTLNLVSASNGSITICVGVDYNSQITSTLMFGLFSEVSDDISSPSVRTVGYTVANYSKMVPFFIVPKDKSSNYYTYLNPDSAFNSNVKIWGLF